MTEFFEPFDPSQYEGSGFDLLPIGVYPAQIIEAEIKVPQSNDGQGVKLVWQIIEGDYEKRQVWQNITYQHSNAQAQEIGRRQLKDLCIACGITTGISGPDPFKFIPCKIRVGIKKDQEGIYDDKNVVTRVWPASYEPPVSAKSTTRRLMPASKSPTASATPQPQASALASPPTSPSLKSPAAKSSAASLMEGMRFTDYQSPNAPQNSPPQTPPPQSSSSSTTDEVKAMIVALHTKSKLAPREISEELAKIDINISTNAIETLLVVWGKYVGGGSNGSTPPQAVAPQPSSQTLTQAPPQPSSQTSTQAPLDPPAQAIHGDTVTGRYTAVAHVTRSPAAVAAWPHPSCCCC
jgi:hypothetical protein